MLTCPDPAGAEPVTERCFENATCPEGRDRLGGRGVLELHVGGGKRSGHSGEPVATADPIQRKWAQVRSNGIPVMYSSNWSGYAALPKTAGQTFTSIVANYNVPAVACSNSPDTFSFHWIGLDGWSDQTVEQDGISANCKGSSPRYNAWYEMYPANSHFEFQVSPGDAIESSIRYLGRDKYELSLKDVTSSQGFDVVQPCPVSAWERLG